MKKEKILFVQKMSDGTLVTEGLWCNKVGEIFVIDNIPFIAKRVSLGDTIKVEYDEDDKSYYFDDFVEVSGNTTVRIFMEDDSLNQEIRDQLAKFGCESEVFLQKKIIAINVPREVNYIPVKAYLEKGEKGGLWTYEESCLAHEY